VSTDLTRFFAPRALAIVGASDDATKIGGRPLRYLLDFNFTGQVYPVNPNRDSVLGMRAYRAVADIPARVDHAIIAVGAAYVEDAVRAAAAKGAIGATIFTSGYAEIGEAGHSAQRRLARLARDLGVRILGPNCQGFANIADGAIATFSSGIERAGVASGPVAVISQSGVISSVVYVLVRQAGVGIGHWVNTGNESDIDAAAVLAFVAQRPEVTTIALALETVRSGDAMADAVRRARASGKRVFVLKGGRSAEGAAAAVSHTAALIGRDDLYDALFTQVGAIRVRTITELVDAVALEARHRGAGARVGSRVGTRRLGIITNSGGTGVLCADAAVASGLQVPRVDAALRNRLAASLPSYATPQNPLDLTSHYITHPEVLDEVAAAFLESGDVDALLIYLGIIGQLYRVDRIVESFARLARTATLPVVAVWQAGDPAVGAQIASTGLPVFDDLDRAVAALAHADAPAPRAPAPRAATLGGAPAGARPAPRADGKPRALEILRHARERQRRVLEPAAGREILACYGIASAEGALCRSTDDAAAAAARLGYPVVAKIESGDVAHKSEVGGVRVGIGSASEAARAYDEIVADITQHAPRAVIAGVRIERQHAGVELVLGMISDPVLGGYVSIGPGGVLVEVIADVVTRRLPLEAGEAAGMLDAMRARALLDGYRLRPPADRAALVDAIERWAALAGDLSGEIAEAEINPLLAGPDGAVAADVLITLTSRGGGSSTPPVSTA
jgi:acyl-CoA synthetase (NDP forming)